MDRQSPELDAALHALETHAPGSVLRTIEGIHLLTGPPLPLSSAQSAPGGGMGLLSVVPVVMGALMLCFAHDPRVVVVGAPLMVIGLVLLWMDAERLQGTLALLYARRWSGYRGTIRLVLLQPDRLTLQWTTPDEPLRLSPHHLATIHRAAPGRLRLQHPDGGPLELGLPRPDAQQTALLLACLQAWRDDARARLRDDAQHAPQVHEALQPLRQPLARPRPTSER